MSRPSRTELLKKPQLLAKLKAEGKPSVEVPAEFLKCVFMLVQCRGFAHSRTRRSGTANRLLEAKEKEREEASKADKGKGKETVKSRKRCVCCMNLPDT